MKKTITTIKELYTLTVELNEFKSKYPFVAKLVLRNHITRFNKDNKVAIDKMATKIQALYETHVKKNSNGQFEVSEGDIPIFHDPISEIEFKAEWEKLMAEPCEIKA